MGLVEWADTRRVLSGKDNMRIGRWKTSAVPYMRGVAEVLWDGRFRRVTVLKPTQTGFTEWLINLIGCCAETRPCPIILAMPARDSLAPVMGEDGRIFRALEVIPEVAGQLNARKASASIIKLTSMNIYGVGAGSPRQGQSKQAQRVLADDGQEISDEFIELLNGRVTSYSGREQIVIGGTPGEEGLAMDKRYKQGDQRMYFCPCPSCGAWQTLEFAQIRWERGTLSPDRAAETSGYQCAACKEILPQSAKAGLLAAGVWVPTRWGASVVDVELFASGAMGLGRGGERVLLAPGVTGHAALAAAMAAYGKSPWEHASFWIKGAMHALEPWGKLAREFVERGMRPNPKWWNERAGEPWREPGERIDVQNVRAMMTPLALGGYRRGTVPPGVLMLAAGVDVQQDRVVYEVAGYGERGLRATIDAGQVAYVGQEGLNAVLLGLAKRAYGLDARHVFTSRGFARLAISAGAVDSGKWTQRVYDAVRAMNQAGLRHWLASKGVGQEGIGSGGWTQPLPYVASRPEKTADGRGVRADSVTLLRVHVSHFKDELFAALRAGGKGPRDEGRGPSEETEALDVLDGGGGKWLMPAVEGDEANGLGTWWAKQITSEERRKTRASNGREVMIWTLRAGASENHALDAAVYADAVAAAMRFREHTTAGVLGRMGVAAPKGKGPRANLAGGGRGPSGAGSVAARRQAREDGGIV